MQIQIHKQIHKATQTTTRSQRTGLRSKILELSGLYVCKRIPKRVSPASESNRRWDVTSTPLVERWITLGASYQECWLNDVKTNADTQTKVNIDANQDNEFRGTIWLELNGGTSHTFQFCCFCYFDSPWAAGHKNKEVKATDGFAEGWVVTGFPKVSFRWKRDMLLTKTRVPRTRPPPIGE